MQVASNGAYEVPHALRFATKKYMRTDGVGRSVNECCVPNLELGQRTPYEEIRFTRLAN